MKFIILTSEETGKEFLVNLSQIQTITEHETYRRIIFAMSGYHDVLETMKTIYQKIKGE